MNKFRNVERWNGVKGTFTVELPVNTEEEYEELEIDFVSSGFYCPATWEEPEDGTEDREFRQARLNGVKLDDEVGRMYFDKYEKQILKTEISLD